MLTTSHSSKLCFILLFSLGLILLGSGAAPAPAAADPLGILGSISLDQPAYTAHENQGSLAVTIQLSGDLSQLQHVGYGVKQQDAQPGIDFNTIANTYATLLPGQTSYTFNVPIIDQGINGPPVHALVYLYGAWPGALGANTNSLITILHDDPLQARVLTDPLGVAPAPASGTAPSPVNGNPILGTKFYVDPGTAVARAARRFAGSNPQWSRMLGRIASQPAAHRFYMWNMGSNVVGQVSHYLQGTQRQQPGSTVMLSTYDLVHGSCGSTATPAMQARYDDFINQVAQGIGNVHAVFFLELDSLITAPCLNGAQLAIRDAELKYAISVLEADPHVVVYLDGGAADAASPGRQAQFLRDAGVDQTQGFFLNSTHFDWMTSELHYGQGISKLLGGAHFIVNSGENGRGPLRPHNVVRQGNEVLCNPPGRGLGPITVRNGVAQQTGYAAADGFLWFSNPGGSGGQCVPGAPPTGVFWPAYAVMLAKNAEAGVTGPHHPLTHSTL